MATPRGFPTPFPVREDGRRPWRYRVVSLLSRIVLGTWFGRGLRIEGIENIPDSGPLVLASNHLSNIDPFLFGAFVPGALFCLAKRELYANPVVAWILGGCNCLPVERGAADRWALRTSLAILQKGNRLVIFIEGTRAPSPGMNRAETGVAFLIRRSGARVLPVAISGTEGALRKGSVLPHRVPVRMRFGAVFTPRASQGQRASDATLAEEIGARVASLLPDGYRGVYGRGSAEAGGDGGTALDKPALRDRVAPVLERPLDDEVRE